MREQDQPSPRKLPRRKAVGVAITLATTGILAAEAARRGLLSLWDKESEHTNGQWQFASIDTMKQSRDAARDRTITPEFIGNQVRAIKELGATHVAIGTPYDDEFIPVLRDWVVQSRKNGLKVWFRGNFAAFEKQHGTDHEGWFGYPHEPDVTKHHQKTYDFITSHPDLFQKGDIFTPWPEPENVIDAYNNQNTYFNFLTTSYTTAQQAFADIGQANKIATNFSMNGDVARRLTPDVVKAIGNTVVIDHHVDDPRKMGEYMQAIIDRYGPEVRLVLGEFGAGKDMTQLEQALFVENLLAEIERFPNNVQGVNYWVMQGGPTGLFTEEGRPKRVTEVIKNHYTTRTKTTK